MNVFVIPVLIECLILISIGTWSNFMELSLPDLVVCLLLFAMGLQNSLVTKISNAIVRTTHLTGLFTDLGIEISQLFFPKSYPNKAGIKSTIKLRLYIIISFFIGGLFGGYLYSETNLKLNTLIVGGVILIFSLFYDDVRYAIIKTKRKHRLK